MSIARIFFLLLLIWLRLNFSFHSDKILTILYVSYKRSLSVSYDRLAADTAKLISHTWCGTIQFTFSCLFSAAEYSAEDHQ